MAARKLSFSLSLCASSQWRGHTWQASFSELAMPAGQSTARPLLFSVCNIQWSYSVNTNAMITPALTQCKRPVCAPQHSHCTSVFPVQSKGTPNTSDGASWRLEKWCLGFDTISVTIAQNVTFMCFLWLLYCQLKVWSTYSLSPSKSVGEKVCFCPLSCLVCNRSVVSHPQENKALGRFVLVCCRLSTSVMIVHVQVCGGKHVSCPRPLETTLIHLFSDAFTVQLTSSVSGVLA